MDPICYQLTRAERGWRKKVQNKRQSSQRYEKFPRNPFSELMKRVFILGALFRGRNRDASL